MAARKSMGSGMKAPLPRLALVVESRYRHGIYLVPIPVGVRRISWSLIPPPQEIPLMAKARATSRPSTAPVRDDRWRIPDALWERIEPLLPPRPPHPLG